MDADLDAGRFAEHRATVRDGVELAFSHEGRGGYPLLLVHGWPETRRIWWRNIAPLTTAGFEVIAPDLRGFGGSTADPDGFHDLAAHARDLHALVHDVLGHERCGAVGGDLGSAIVIDLGLRFPGFVERACIFNGPLPLLPDEYAAAGLGVKPPPEVRAAADYFVRQGREADALCAELRSAEERRRYVAQFYGSRLWASPGSFDAESTAFHTEPFADEEHLRAGLGNYESALGTRALSEPPRFFERSPVPTLALYGLDDHVIWPDYPERCRVALERPIGPFVVPGCGHFLQWERADALNSALTYLFADLATTMAPDGGVEPSA